MMSPGHGLGAALGTSLRKVEPITISPRTKEGPTQQLTPISYPHKGINGK